LTNKAITERVTNSDFSSYKIQTAETISQMVKKDNFGSLITQHYDEIVQAISDVTGSHEFVLNSYGATVKNGGFKIEDSNGYVIFKVNTNGSVGIVDLEIEDTSVGSAFYNALANMDRISCGEISPNRLTLNQDDFYIGNGYTLDEWIDRRLDYHSLI
jgi:hypothetical protein